MLLSQSWIISQLFHPLHRGDSYRQDKIRVYQFHKASNKIICKITSLFKVTPPFYALKNGGILVLNICVQSYPAISERIKWWGNFEQRCNLAYYLIKCFMELIYSNLVLPIWSPFCVKDEIIEKWFRIVITASSLQRKIGTCITIEVISQFFHQLNRYFS